jgi:hypothetical protein
MNSDGLYSDFFLGEISHPGDPINGVANGTKGSGFLNWLMLPYSDNRF